MKYSEMAVVKPSGVKRRFEVTFSLFDGYGEDVDTCIIELDQVVIDSVDDEWRQFFYPSVNTPERVAAHIARNMHVNNLRLSDMDGFANHPNTNVKMIDWASLSEFYTKAKEIEITS